MGCGCGGSVWTPPTDGSVQSDASDQGGARGIDNPATFWTGPGMSEPEPEPVTADAE